MRRFSLAVALTLVASFAVATSAAQAVVVDMNKGARGQTSVTYPTDKASYFGVAMVPGTLGNLQGAGVKIPTVSSGMPCSDPTDTPYPDIFLPPNAGLCSHGGAVLHKTETFAFVWDPNGHRNWAGVYVERFLRDVADASGTFSSPFALLPQYTDAGGRAQNNFLFGGGSDDGAAYPTSGCSFSGTNPLSINANFVLVPVPNDVCLTDAQIKYKLQGMIQQQQLTNHIQPGYSPLLVVLTPPGVETCLDDTAQLCSANSDPDKIPGTNSKPAQFCSYHSQVTGLDGHVYPYVVQPITALAPFAGNVLCDEPDATPYPNPVPADQLVDLTGQRLVSPLSQAMMAAITNPGFDGWSALDGSEINDNGKNVDNPFQTNTLGCVPVKGVDLATLAGKSYLLQREFNNGGAIVQDPYALPCSEGNALVPDFVVPSPINSGDVVEFDGFRTPTTLLIPRANFKWDFGDGTTGVGPSPVHIFAHGGTYTVALTVTDRGGNTATISHPVPVLGAGGQVVPPAPTTGPRLQARMSLMPQGLRSMLKSGLVVRVTSNLPANGIVTFLIPRKRRQAGAHPRRACAVGRDRPRHGRGDQERHRQPASAAHTVDGHEAEPPAARDRHDPHQPGRQGRRARLDRRGRPLLGRPPPGRAIVTPCP